MALLEVEHLHTFFRTKKGIVRAVNDVSYSVEKGRTLGIVGESGSGKSVSAMSILKLLDGNGYIDSGSIRFEGQELTRLSARELYAIRGNAISMIFQEPMTSLHPVFTVERQGREPFMVHQHLSRREASARVLDMLRQVRIPNPEVVAKQYPHELSGGMRQRVMIAMALACRPRLLIADEPTTALDVTIQAQILRLIRELQASEGTAVLFITHDLGVIRQMADDVVVMYCGQVVEQAPVSLMFSAGTGMLHPYTEGLMRSIPSLETNRGEPLEAIPGSVPHPLALPRGCKFADRCRYACARCREKEPQLTETEPGHLVRCLLRQGKVAEKAAEEKAAACGPASAAVTEASSAGSGTAYGASSGEAAEYDARRVSASRASGEIYRSEEADADGTV